MTELSRRDFYRQVYFGGSMVDPAASDVQNRAAVLEELEAAGVRNKVTSFEYEGGGRILKI